VHQQWGELPEALNYFNEALSILKNATQPDHAAIGQVLTLMGNVYLQRGDATHLVAAFSEAMRSLRAADKCAEQLSISGFNFYQLSKMHPECAPQA
jgi:predicted negative regulator of RcsB-dependent stress response